MKRETGKRPPQLSTPVAEAMKQEMAMPAQRGPNVRTTSRETTSITRKCFSPQDVEDAIRSHFELGNEAMIKFGEWGADSVHRQTAYDQQ